MKKLKIIILFILLAPALFGQLRYLPPTLQNIARTKDEFTGERLKHPEEYLVMEKNKEVIARSNNWFYRSDGLFYRNLYLTRNDSIKYDKTILGTWGSQDERTLFVFSKPADSKYLILTTYKYQDYMGKYLLENKSVQLGALDIDTKFYFEFNAAGDRQFIQEANKYYLVNYSFTNEDIIQFRQVSKRYYYKNPDVEITEESPIVSFTNAAPFRSYIADSQVKEDFFIAPYALHRVKKKISVAVIE